MAEVTTVFAALLAEAQQLTLTQQQQWWAAVDPDHNSPCQYGEVVADEVAWWPVQRSVQGDFSGLASALELQLDPQFQQLFGGFYGGGLKVSHQRGPLEILMVWHDADFERLQQNLVAHILMKRRLKQRETLFFAVTDDDDILLSVLNETGEVYLERVGQEVSELLAADLSQFMSQLKPVG